ncbi:hypothetical protein [Methylobacterium thuringiense]|uniref:ANTAR domain-containing protein n=1 Tax=Methylobacterium thuringiense TaxID=1003091 RepID=A0ABQ4TIQ4_9HYPH|nr:hypothetical protein [Methylobacterium thuringiense]GJE55259.1 hypothetical protein EKPJFOCH_1748 [Methylobacterium thuringiense]
MLFQAPWRHRAPAPIVTPLDAEADASGRAVMQASEESGVQALRAVAASHQLDTANSRVQRILGDVLANASHREEVSDL